MTPERPAFFEGQILAAADLTSAIDYGRGQAARHERYLHDWGIAEGLEFTKTPDTSGKYVDVMLGSGVAIDGTGREIVVPAPVLLSTADFFNANGASPQAGANYPVLLHGIDTVPPAAPLATGACGPGSQPTRTQEGFGLTFGALGADLSLDQQQVPDVSAGPGPAAGNPWEVLVGFVQWDASAQKFTDATDAPRRYAGVMADRVSARSGTLALRSQPTATPGQPVLVVGGNPPALTFGLYQGGSNVDPRLTVSAQGDVTATGTIKGALSPLAQGEIHVQSGIATNGVVIPLPVGITEDQVSNGGVILHLHLTPHTPQSVSGTWYVPVECSVDASRRLTCQVIVGNTLSFTGTVQQSGAADYLMVATVVSGANS
jgi:hypothetical protein